MNMISTIIENKYDFIWKSLIRPPRDIYKDIELGRDKFRMNGKNYKRTDFSIYNSRKMKLQCSFWEPFDEERICARLPVVIFLPGNSSSRCEALPLLGFLLPVNISVFAFDFCGSGRSDGEYISLGYYEKEDVKTIINYLRSSNKVSTIGLWGRSMGAVTSILCSKEFDKNDKISCVVSDSAFSSLNKLIDEIVDNVIKLPQFLMNILKEQVGNIIERKANFRIEKIEPIENLDKCKNIPILFCHALHDTFIDNHHCNDLYKAYGGKKEIVMFEGEHNDKRPLHILQIISLFFYNHLKVKNIIEISFIYNKNYKQQWNTISSLYDEKKQKDFDDEFDISNDEDDYKSNIVRYFSVARPKVKNYFETI